MNNFFSTDDLFEIRANINYWACADSSNNLNLLIKCSKEEARKLMDKIDKIIEEEKFYREWGIYENETIFSIQDIKYFISFIETSENFWERNDVDIRALFMKDKLKSIHDKLKKYIEMQNIISTK
jgi:hypothetical protein